MLAVSMLLAAFGWTWPAIVMLYVTGAYDLWLCRTEYGTITKFIRKQLPWQIDFAVVCGIAFGVWWLWGAEAHLSVVIGIIFGHLFWSEHG